MRRRPVRHLDGAAVVPQRDGALALAGLAADVTVHRDDHGIPQLWADSAADLFRAQGFVQAQDGFREMDFRRHVTAGRLSELFGPDQVDTDEFVRTLGWRRVAEQELELLAPTTMQYLLAYAGGVNAYLDGRSGSGLSLEHGILALTNRGYHVERWTPLDSVSWRKAMAWDLRSNLDDELDRALLSRTLDVARVEQLYPAYPFEKHPTILTTALPETYRPNAAGTVPSAGQARVLRGVKDLHGSGIGSNSWVVAGRYTASGAPLLANDPHLGPSLPSVWTQPGLHCTTVSADCPFDVAGFTFSGVPGVVIGHNASLAWGFTNLAPDVADVYLERITGDTYEYDGQQRPLDVRSETIRIAGAQPRRLTIRATQHGPLVSDVVRWWKRAGPSCGQPPRCSRCRPRTSCSPTPRDTSATSHREGSRCARGTTVAGPPRAGPATTTGTSATAPTASPTA